MQEKNLIKEHLEQCEQSLSKEKSHVLNLSLQKDTLHHQLKETEIRNKQLKNDKDSLNQVCIIFIKLFWGCIFIFNIEIWIILTTNQEHSFV